MRHWAPRPVNVQRVLWQQEKEMCRQPPAQRGQVDISEWRAGTILHLDLYLCGGLGGNHVTAQTVDNYFLDGLGDASRYPEPSPAGSTYSPHLHIGSWKSFLSSIVIIINSRPLYI